MKKIILSAITLFVFSTVFGQTEKAQIMIGADSSLSFSSEKFENEDNAATSFNISPQAGYFVINDLAVGLGINYTSTKDGDLQTSQFLIGPLARYYFLEGCIKPFLQAEFLFGNNKIDNGEGGNDFTVKRTQFGLSGGVSFFLNDFIAIDASLLYGALTEEADISSAEKVNGTSFGLNIGFNLFF